jgi:hypothetical protein
VLGQSRPSRPDVGKGVAAELELVDQDGDEGVVDDDNAVTDDVDVNSTTATLHSYQSASV